MFAKVFRSVFSHKMRKSTFSRNFSSIRNFELDPFQKMQFIVLSNLWIAFGGVNWWMAKKESSILGSSIAFAKPLGQ